MSINKVTTSNLTKWLAYHAPDEQQIDALIQLRYAAGKFASEILLYCPDCADTSAALRLLKQTLMTANQSIILENIIE